MKNLLFLILTLLVSTKLYSQISISDKSQKPKIKSIAYDGTFIDFNDLMITEEQKAGVVGLKVTLLDVFSSSLKKLNGDDIDYKDSEKFKNKTFLVTEYIYDYKDILKIQNETGEWLFKPSSIDKYVFNKYIDTLKSKIENKTFIPLKFKDKVKSLDGEERIIDGNQEYKFTEVTYSKTTDGYDIVVKLNNQFEMIYPTETWDQENEKGWVNLSSSDIFKLKSTFIEKSKFVNFKSKNKLFVNEIRKGNVKIGMSKKQCVYSWGIPTSSVGSDILVYGEFPNAQYLYFKGGILKKIK